MKNPFIRICSLLYIRSKLTLFILTIACLYTGPTSAQHGTITYNQAQDVQEYTEFVRNFVQTELPGGAFIFHPSALSGLSDINLMLGLYFDKGDISFKLISKEYSKARKGLVTYRYQQYIGSVPLENAGYAITGIDEDAKPDHQSVPTGPGPIDCFQPISFFPHIYNVPQKLIESKAQKSRKVPATLQVKNRSDVVYLKQSYIIAEASGKAILSDVYLFSGNAHHYKGWFNALTGEEVKRIELDAHVNGDTGRYGVQNLDDSVEGNMRLLRTADGLITTHDFRGRLTVPNRPVDTDYTVNNIAEMAAAAMGWPNVDADTELLYASHFVAQQIIPVFQNIGITFTNVRVAADPAWGNASSIDTEDTRPNEATIAFGIIGGANSAMYDVAAHELGHSYLNRFFSYNDNGLETQTIHEAFSDMTGCFGEAVVDVEDWIMIDDEPTLAGVARDLANPTESCWTNSQTLGRYPRGGPLRNWYFQVATDANGIVTFPQADLLPVVLDAVSMLNGSSDVQDFVDATIISVANVYGLCSPQYRSVLEAWTVNCFVRTQCEYNITGPNSACAGFSGLLTLNVTDPLPGVSYRWNFPPEWDIQGVPSGNGSTYASFIRITGIPTYNSYPRQFTIQVYAPALGSEFTDTHTFTVNDCGDDPCRVSAKGIYHSDKVSPATNSPSAMNLNEVPPEATHLRVVDLMGRILYTGTAVSMNAVMNTLGKKPTKGIYVIVYQDANGAIIENWKILL
ncbi:hypothetical protein FUA23_10920 [Neolewinella aurantiaca]|uniref:Uncharacterized protein n=1 Tax=Neolewinella aurantiaca TaxID=2602767 RepID=A0A5C7FET2_9BACT|nr:hypothetical protein [Neolewinella aurantiaca]TXF89255.1 hypothetical protein FUA23_10920 [Neolewinella aurantiaca]